MRILWVMMKSVLNVVFCIVSVASFFDCQAQKRPNVLFIIADDMSKNAGVYGELAIKTPAIDNVARQGVVFENAFVTASSCTPSRASILTGKYPHQLQQGGNLWGTLPLEYANFVTVLGEAGYFTGSSGKGWGPGNEKVGGYKFNPAGKPFKNFEQFLSQRPDDKPFFFWLGAFDPHRPYSDSLTKKTDIDKSKIKIPGWLPQEDIVRDDVADYLAEVKRFDGLIERTIASLRQKDLLENTLIIITSDNGMPFPRGKATVYDSGTNVPFVMSWGNKFKKGHRPDAFISLSNVAATILDATGVKDERFGNNSFLQAGFGKPVPSSSFVFVERERHASVREGNLSYPVRAIRTKDYLYIENLRPDRWPAGDPERYGDIDGGPTKKLIVSNADNKKYQKWVSASLKKRPATELYLLANDKDQLNNVASDPKQEHIIKKLKSQLDEWRKNTGDPLLGNNEDIFDSYPYYGSGKFLH